MPGRPLPFLPRRLRKASAMSVLASLPHADGKWIARGVFQTSGGEICFKIGHLLTHYKVGLRPPSARQFWYGLLQKPCPDLDPGVNGGKARAYNVRGECRRKNGRVIVLAQGDVEKVIARRVDREKRRESPSGSGRWLVNDLIFQRTDGVLFYTEGQCKAVAEDAGDPIGSDGTLSELRRRGVLGWMDVPKVNRGPGQRTLAVSSQKDFERYLSGRREQRERARGTVAPAGWLTQDGMYKLAGIEDRRAESASEEVIDLTKDCGVVLRRFRRECPASAAQISKWSKKQNRCFQVWHYDPAAFLRWLDGRDLRALASAERGARPPQYEARARKRLHHAVRFLEFVLTRGRYSPRAFARFLRRPPVGQTLQPCPPVRSRDIMEWAKAAGVGKSGRGGMLYQAKRALKVKHLRRLPVCWWLTGPITIEASEFDAPAVAGGNGSGAPARKAEGDGATRVKRQRALHLEWEHLHDGGMSYADIARRQSKPTSPATVESAIKRLRRERRKAAAPK